MRPSRRDVLAGLGGAALLGGLGLGRSARAAAGDLTLSATPLEFTFPVLEIFLAGGLSHQETIWLESASGPTWCPSSGYDFTNIHGSLSGATGFELGSSGVYLGPMCTPLVTAGWQPYTRVCALAHDLPPHAAAVPLALGGYSLGRPLRAGLGAAIERNAGSVASAPAAYVLHSGRDSDALHASAVGRHGAESRPLVLSLGNLGGRVVNQMARRSAAGNDSLLLAYDEAYERKLRRVRIQPESRVRSSAYEAYSAARRRLVEAEHIVDSLVPTIVPATFLEHSASEDFGDSTNVARAAVRAGIQLIANGGAQYVCVIDDGVGSAHYDTHESAYGDQTAAFKVQAGNLWQVLDELTTTLSVAQLEGMVVVLNTEFGRKYVTAGGTEHHTDGYAVMLMGGPIVSAGVGGALNFAASGGPEIELTSGGVRPGPTHLRAALHMAAGLDPLHADCFDSADIALGMTSDPLADLADYFFGR